MVDERQSKIIELEIMPDHVHLLVEVDPQYGVHKLLKQIKGFSSRILRQEFPLRTTPHDVAVLDVRLDAAHQLYTPAYGNR